MYEIIQLILAMINLAQNPHNFQRAKWRDDVEGDPLQCVYARTVNSARRAERASPCWSWSGWEPILTNQYSSLELGGEKETKGM